MTCNWWCWKHYLFIYNKGALRADAPWGNILGVDDQWLILSREHALFLGYMFGDRHSWPLTFRFGLLFIEIARVILVISIVGWWSPTTMDDLGQWSWCGSSTSCALVDNPTCESSIYLVRSCFPEVWEKFSEWARRPIPLDYSIDI